MIRLSQLIGQRVIAESDGSQLGSIRRLLLDPASGSIAVAQLEVPAGGNAMLEWSAVRRIGDDAVLVAAPDVTRAPDGERELQLISGDLELLGKSVLTDEGNALGELADVDLNEASGRVTQIHLADESLFVGRFVALGPDAIIVASSPPAG